MFCFESHRYCREFPYEGHLSVPFDSGLKNLMRFWILINHNLLDLFLQLLDDSPVLYLSLHESLLDYIDLFLKTCTFFFPHAYLTRQISAFIMIIIRSQIVLTSYIRQDDPFVFFV